ncbi:glycoside hydrolase family 127 protein [Sinomicrobium weinanense]|uniref:Glycoside hydrolase family 127 protein n=1 Tax=Sinomicrobium weinanense TaxID=2842200 RepID=A0A926JPD3_9FLAO|nr:glycoside hydrolase family 127 protein [Sinomicrobium weinanense]MBC9794941.1 glycoside hydrolase family 127 protein [Sinomicrobium weinanense]MBU3125712.1 glycoside hydrolase family 127 protein [Sinomicrobium weinanense]
MRQFIRIWPVLLLFITVSCQEKKHRKNTIEDADHKETGYLLEPVDIKNVKLTDKFWLPVIETVQKETIAYAIKKCIAEGRFDNFLIAGGKMEGRVKGKMPFDDTDVYKIIEGASYSLISAPNPELEKQLDSLIGIIKTGQEEDGYLTTWRTIDPARPPSTWVDVKEGKRWESLSMSHELYNAGHLYEAAAAHYRATGKKNFLEIALKNADLIVNTFGDGETKIHAVPGHQIIETGLIKLYQITGKDAYLDLARYFLDNRGNPHNHELFGTYSQDHVPVTQQNEVVGHAVRAVYMYAAMTDIAALQNDMVYEKAVNKLWHNMVNKKMYITGGIGARHEGEAFGEDYELPNLTAYNETCASIGDVYWNHRLHNLHGDAAYFDIIERTLYNGLISGLSLDGKQFFYPNALESDGIYKFNQGACTRKDWFDCSCCPTNMIRFIPSISGLIYSRRQDTVYVNLYASNKASIALEDNTVAIEQTTDYPRDGKVGIKINPEKNTPFTLRLRVPGWVRNQVLPGNLYSYKNPSDGKISLWINGEETALNSGDEYITLTKNWKKGETVTLRFPMQVKKVVTHPEVAENKGKVALEYGPMVYAIEEIDNKGHFDTIKITDEAYTVHMEKGLLNGVKTITGEQIKAIPYYAWSNRGVGKMKVWIDTEEE